MKNEGDDSPNPVLKQLKSRSENGWLRSKRETGQAAPKINPPERNAPTARAVSSREPSLKMQNFQPEGPLRLDFLVRLEPLLTLFRTPN